MACLTAVTGSGIPVFTRTYGGLVAPSFPTIGALNGVHMFSSSHGVTLVTEESASLRIAWRTFHDSFVLVLVTDTAGPLCVGDNRLLDLAFGALVLVLGIDGVVGTMPSDRLKRDARSAFRLIDSVFDMSGVVSRLLRAAETSYVPDVPIIRKYLDSFAANADSSYACVMCRGSTLAATDSWWKLSIDETSLLASFVASLPGASMHDVPVYLPTASPQVPHRLIVIQPLDGIRVVALCGPSPPLREIDDELFVAHWQPALAVLRAAVEWVPKGFPPSTTIDPGMASATVLHRASRRCFTWTRRAHDSKPDLVVSKKYAIANFIVSMGPFFPEMLDSNEESCIWNGSHHPVELYSTTKEWKIYSLRHAQAVIIGLFDAHVPIYALEALCESVLTSILQAKIFN